MVGGGLIVVPKTCLLGLPPLLRNGENRLCDEHQHSMCVLLSLWCQDVNGAITVFVLVQNSQI